MLSRLVLASLCTGALAGIFPRDSWGPAVSLGPVKSTIKKSTVIIVPNSPPPSQAGLLYLWPGMSNGTGDLIQSTIDQYPNGGGCGAGGTGSWCGGASLFGSVGQISGPYVPVSATQRIKIVYERGASAGNGLWAWTQTVSDATTGSVLSTLTHNSGTMIGWGTAVECNDGCSGTTCTHWYQDATIELDSADTTFTSTLGASQGASYSNVVSSNGGQIWKIGLITIPAMNPGGGSCALSSPPSSGSSGTTTTTTTKATTTTIKATTTTTKATTTTASSGSGGTQVLYGQCGGIGWTGPTTCVSGSTCKYSNDWYSQCLA